MRGYVWAFIFSVALHAALLSQINLKNEYPPSSKQPTLTVNLAPFPAETHNTSLPSRPRSSPPNTSHEDAEEPHSGDIPRPTAPSATSNMAKTIEASPLLDIEQLRNQARADASREHSTSEPVISISGDYYGSYAGSDSGTFYFHLDRNGIASGNGQSNTFGVSFIITGNATSNGVIQMSGSGRAGNARFEGKLNIKTGMLSGTWSLIGIGSGAFSGRHE